jgi:peptidoglycan hydrolase CwlO-like protein
MFKKIGIAAVVVAVVLFLLNSTMLGSYTGTAWSKIHGSFKKQVPLEFEIERIKHEIAQLVPDMKKNLSQVAEEMVAIDNLKEQIADAHRNLDTQKASIMTMTEDLEKGAQTVSYKGVTYSANRIREKLARDFTSYQNCEKDLKAKEQLLDARERGLDAAREQLSSIRSQKQELEVQVEQLEAELKAVRLAQTRNKFHFDDSRLAHCKQILADIKNRLKVEKTQEELSGQFANDPTVAVEPKVKSTPELSREIKAYFNGNSESPDKVAADKK